MTNYDQKSGQERVKLRAGSVIEYYDDLSLNATQLLVKYMKLASIKRIQEQSLARKRKQDVLDSICT